MDGGATVEAKAAVVATNAPVSDRLACDGAAPNGPATSALARVEQEAHGRGKRVSLY